MINIFRKGGVVGIISGFLVDLGSGSSLSYMWGFGSLLGVFLVFQLVTGVYLAANYVDGVGLAFDNVVHLMRDVGGGWVIRIFHSNGASFFFVLLYFHMGRGMYYMSYVSKEVWVSGVTLLLVFMGVAFLGYVLPWGQMSFWAATVITNLLSAVPYFGVFMVEWVWGGYAVGGPTLTRFFMLHFILPVVLIFVVFIHLYFLHDVGSGNVMGLCGGVDSVSFHPFYVYSDVLGVFFAFLLVGGVSFYFPFVFMDVENFIEANAMITPEHIQPEWYFLFAYAILRSVPSSVGGVVALLFSLGVLYVLPLVKGGFSFKIAFWVLVADWLLLTWGGSCVVEYPYIEGSQMFSIMYFLFIIGFVSVSEFKGVFL